MRRQVSVLTIAALVCAVGPGLAAQAAPHQQREEDLLTKLHHAKFGEPEEDVVPGDPGATAPGNTGSGGSFSKTQIERFRCSSGGDPAVSVDMSCNTQKYRQDVFPDNEIAVAADPEDPDHLLAGSNDYFYRFNNSTGARQAIVLTGFFTSFDGGATWTDGQIPVRRGNGAGDPVPAFSARDGLALMAQLENTAGLSGAAVTNGDVTVSRSTDGGNTWSEPTVAINGIGAGIGPANRATFIDKEWMTVDNYPDSPHYGRIYVTATKFTNGLQGSYARSPIVLVYSDDGGLHWSRPQEISGSSPTCTFQTTGAANECDEDQFSIPEVAADGTLYVHFFNAQNEDTWEHPLDFDDQIMVVKSTDGGVTFSDPTVAAFVEDGLSDMPFSVISRQTIWGHQLRWNALGTLTADPSDPQHLAIVFADRGTPNPNATDGCFFELPGEAPDYDPCDAGPGSNTDVWMVESTDGGMTWSSRTRVSTETTGLQEWFPYADFGPDGTLSAGWDRDLQPSGPGFPPPNDTFRHVLKVGAGAEQELMPNAAEGRATEEHLDVSVTHWAGQYVPQAAWPTVCGPVGYSDDGIPDAEGKDCNVFHGDYTGLAVGSDGSINVVWTGLNRFVTSPQTDVYTGEQHDGYAQDAMFARR